MRILHVFTLLGLALLIGIFPSELSAQVTEQGRQPISPGYWKGTLSIRKNASDVLSAPIMLRLLKFGSGGLLDIPSQSMFGYPLDEVTWTPNRLRFSMDALGPGEEMKFDGFLTSTGTQAGSIVGTAVSASWRGSFVLSRDSSGERPVGIKLDIPVDGGTLPGTLELPRGASSGQPLVILLSGAGTSDRDGNNYNVPGKTNVMALLATGLSKLGVASFRFDRRGAGEAYFLEAPGRQTSLDSHADDVVKILAHFTLDGTYSRIVMAGMNEGAWIGAKAVVVAEAQGIPSDGLIVLDASGTPPLEDLMESLARLDEDTRAEADLIIKALLADADYPEPSDALSDFFSRGRREWLGSWLRMDPPSLLATLQCPVLFVIGQNDMQVQPESFERLLAARPAAPARIIPGMNYALKEVKNEEENFNSFTSADYPVPKSLVDLVAAFVKAKPAPSGSIPYKREALQASPSILTNQ